MGQIKFDLVSHARMNVRAFLCYHSKRSYSPFLSISGVVSRHSGGWSTPMKEAHFAVGEIGMHRAMIIRRFQRNWSRLLLHVENPQSLRTSFILTQTRISILIL